MVGLVLGLLLVGLSLAADTKPPSVTILDPTTASSYTTTSAQLQLKGTSRDPHGTVVRVDWLTDRATAGPAKGTTKWSATVPVELGTTRITVQAVDSAGNVGRASLTVTRTEPVTAAPPGAITVEWSYTSSVGEVFQLERCAAPCGAMAPIAKPSFTVRSWVDTDVLPTLSYCYRIAVLHGGTVGPYSQTLCSVLGP